MLHQHSKSPGYKQRPMLSVVIAVLGLIIACTLLVACGEATDPGNADASGTPMTGMSKSEATAVAMVTGTAEAINQQVSGAGSELEAAVHEYLIRNITTPYKDVSIKVLSQDDAYATVEVHVMLRLTADSPWDENVATLEFALVNGQWKVSKTATFASVAGQATTTAQAQIAGATATAGMEARILRDARVADLHAIHMLSATEGWALGRDVILHYTGGVWAPQSIPPGLMQGSHGLIDIYMHSASDGWIVGGHAAPNGALQYNDAFVLHYDGSQWSQVGALPGDGKGYILASIDMVSPTEGWAVGNSTILHYTTNSTEAAGKWESVKAPGERNYHLLDVKMVSASEGWATGGNGVMLHYTGEEWIMVESGVHDHMYCLAVVSPTDVWALGDYGHATHYDGKSWTEPDLALNWSNYFRFRGASFSSPSDGWAVDEGRGKFLHFSNGKWQELEETLSPKRNKVGGEGLSGIHMLSSEEGWAVGEGGAILYFTNGKWEEIKR